ncbi:MAG: tetratricopeptide repeat protein [Planctomycetes bacterium]|nr:tetratricopeptide repeat protein [Planctomycetota bacterium]
MAETTPDNPTETSQPPGGAEAPRADYRWSELWQLPVLLAGVLMLAGWWVVTVRGGHKADDFEGTINSTAQFLKANNAEGARTELNKLLPNQERATREQQARIKQLWADTIYLDTRAKDVEHREEWAKIVELYGDARSLGMEFDADHLKRWSDTLASLGRDDEALKLLETMGDAGAPARYALLRGIIESQRRSGAKPDRLAALTNRFQDEMRHDPTAARRRPQEVWLTRFQATLYLDGDDNVRAVDFLNQRMGRLVADGGDHDLAPLMATLAQAYQRSGDTGRARKMFLAAKQKIDPEDPLNAEVLVGLGRLDLADGADIRSALTYFSDAMARFPTDAVASLDAVLGRADCEARLGAHGDAVDHYKTAVQMVRTHKELDERKRDEVTDAVRGHFEENSDRGQYPVAIEYLRTLVPMFPRDQELPPRLLLDFAATLEKIAEAEFAEGMGADTAAKKADPSSTTLAVPTSGKSSGREGAVSPARQLAFQRAAGHFEEAAGYYMRHAHAIESKDDAAYGVSLWHAAAAYDRAQLWPRVIEVYSEFVRNRPNDSRQLVARLRLGQAYEADRQFQAALDQFQLIQAKEPRSPEAYAALVPMARCMVALRHPDDAERILRHVITNHPTITPDSEAYRQAIIELSGLYYRAGRFADAIPYLSFAVDRYRDQPEAPTLRFRLADAYRRSVEELAKAMEDPMPQSRRLALEAERTRRLEQAIALYTGVISEIEGRKQQELSPLESLYFRNAFFYRADCAYDLRRFEQAIQLYEIAARRWENHPSALVALVQIVNANAELGRVQDARVATRKAQAMLKRIPEERFNDETVPMSRKHWEEWLRWTSELNLFDAADGASKGAAVQAGGE